MVVEPRERRAGGLSAGEASRLLAVHGPNVLPSPASVPVWRRLAAQMIHFFALMLWVAGLLAFVAGLPVLGVAIFVVVVINGLFAFLQQYRADRAAHSLRALLPSRATVRRGGSVTVVDAATLVPGDVVLLSSGDRVSADLECLVAHDLRVDVSTLTGESVPVSVEAAGQLSAGSFVVEGEGEATVARTGASTRLAEIAQLTQQAKRPETPLSRELHRLVRTIAAIAVAVGIVFFLLTLVLDTSPSDGFVFAVGITVALVPEALLPTVTLSLAIGAQRMARQHALVRRLESVETLGSTTFICTDKTGTLTENRMNVVEVWTPSGRTTIRGHGYEPRAEVETARPAARGELVEAASAARRCSTGRSVLEDGEWVAQGDPMEAAIDVLARRVCAGSEAGDGNGELARFPFDPRRRRMSVVTRERILVKGAPDSVLALCAHDTGAAHRALERMSERGLRVLAVAHRNHAGVVPSTASDAESDLVLLGLLGFEDPPRPGAAQAIETCRSAGIRVAMITGDHPATAVAIACEIGLAKAGAGALLGSELPSDEQVLGALVDRDGVVLARVSPEDKLRIAHALRMRGHVVAMTGDGVNDGPALREADIGIAMGRSGTDVAREAADLVLLDDDFATIVAAVRQGRAVFANARRFLTYHLTDNVAELTPFAIWALSGGKFPLALGVLQILALDIGTDTLSAVALGAEPPARDVLRRPPTSGRLLDRGVALRSLALLGPLEAAFAIGAFLTSFALAGWRPTEPFPGGTTLAAASGAAFLTVVVAQTANAFACRSTRLTPWRIGWTTNHFLVVGVLIELAITAAFLIPEPVADLLEHAPPEPLAWVVIAASAPALLAADATWKWLRNRSARPAPSTGLHGVERRPEPRPPGRGAR